jgi:hypothetical protein
MADVCPFPDSFFLASFLPNLFLVRSRHISSRSRPCSKQGGKRSSWKKRWFVLSGRDVLYFAKNNEGLALGGFSVFNARIVAYTEREFAFGVATSGRTYNVACASKSEMDQWVQAFQTAIAGHSGAPEPSGPDAVLSVLGLASPQCVAVAESVVRALPGVAKVVVDAEASSIQLFGHDGLPSATVPAAVEVLEDAGFIAAAVEA